MRVVTMMAWDRKWRGIVLMSFLSSKEHGLLLLLLYTQWRMLAGQDIKKRSLTRFPRIKPRSKSIPRFFLYNKKFDINVWKVMRFVRELFLGVRKCHFLRVRRATLLERKQSKGRNTYNSSLSTHKPWRRRGNIWPKMATSFHSSPSSERFQNWCLPNMQLKIPSTSCNNSKARQSCKSFLYKM